MKKTLCLIAILLCLAGSAVAMEFSDVAEGAEGYEAIGVLSEKGILTGFPDGTFRPEASITRAEAATVIVRMMGYSTDDASSIYSDVPNDFWAKPYIMAATREGILDGMGGGRFAPKEPVTYPQIVKMLVCAVGEGETAEKAGGWPMGYVDTAKELEILNPIRHKIVTQSLTRPAPRAVVANYTYAAMLKFSSDANTVTVAGYAYRLGQSAANLPAADEVLPSTAGFQWHVYGIGAYENFHAIGVRDGKIVAIGAEGSGFRFGGYGAGDMMPVENDMTHPLRYDKNDNNRIHGVLLLEDVLWEYYAKDVSPVALDGEARMNFHCTNAFRVMHGLNPLQWSEPCAVAARLHSQDMADRNYFQHDSLDGRKFYDRLVVQGVNYGRCGENIYAGQNLGFSMHDGWVNSAGHRKNILGDYVHLGIGGGHSETSKYKVYFTQDFFR